MTPLQAIERRTTVSVTERLLDLDLDLDLGDAAFSTQIEEHRLT
jgi:hypothetical protein